ncbi:hypothetical protein [Sodalis-like endosymbiont of Proechinophthirus fluctus]|uniref:hypothetical protein n=1 Tax=Sodalis-like endosymbiont of Proechinophthirus fluctus TaxID=1462730 RepID=UPI000A6854C4
MLWPGAAQLRGEHREAMPDLLETNDQLLELLFNCYQSLRACGMTIIAIGQLLDTL